jgi:hypothetical protein
MKTHHNTITKRRALLFLIAFVLLAASLACGSGVGEPTPTPSPTTDPTAPGQVQGVLLDGDTGRPLADVTVGLVMPGHSSGGMTYIEQTDIETETDTSGAFLLDSVPPGEYMIFAYLGRQELVTDSTSRHLLFEVRPGQTFDLGEIEVNR